MKATAIAPSNVAFIKYWGRKDEKLRLPQNSSISMNLSNLFTITTVEFSEKYAEDTIIINQRNEPLEKAQKIIEHLDRIRKLAKIKYFAKVVSKNSFPRGTGLSSSASGFAALTFAATNALGMEISEKELSILSRQGSGSSCRSIPGGFVEWLKGDKSEESYAYSLYRADYWDIIDIVVVLTEKEKEVATSEGQTFVQTSPFYERRLSLLDNKIALLKKAMRKKDFTGFGEIVEAEALELHAIMLTSHPSLLYWYPTTVSVMQEVKQIRKDGIECYFTLNTGQNIHILCQKKNSEKLSYRISRLHQVKKVIQNTPAKGVCISNNHLF